MTEHAEDKANQYCLSTNKKKKGGWEHGSSCRAPQFKPQYYFKNKKGPKAHMTMNSYFTELCWENRRVCYASLEA